MAKKEPQLIKTIKIAAPEIMTYDTYITTEKDRLKYVERVKRVIRSSQEYKDYISFLKEHIGLDRCVFFQNITNGDGKKRNRVTIHMHHEPLTLHDIVNTVINKFQQEDIPLNDLMIADEVMQLHYENKVGLVPLSITAHQIVHNSSKLFVPINLCYGNYSAFLSEYEPYIDKEIFDKIEKKMIQTENLTPESFDAITKEFSYLQVEGYDEVEKMEIKDKKAIA